MSKVISTEMKALVKSSPFYLMLMVCAKDSMLEIEDTPESYKAWEDKYMPALLEAIDQGLEVPADANLIKLVYGPEFNYPFDADTLHGIIDEFLVRVEANEELKAFEETHRHAAREYYIAAKERFANV